MSDEPKPESPWRFKAVIEGELVHISATFDLSGVETFKAKLSALKAVLDSPTQSPSTTEQKP